MLLLVAPLTFYFGNRSEYQISSFDVVLALAVISLLGFAALLGLLHSVTHNARNRFSALLISIAFAIWVQSQLFAWNYGPLDGRGINWERWNAHSLAELVAWAIIVSVGYVIAARSTALRRALLQGLIVLGVLSTGAAMLTSSQRADTAGRKAVSDAFVFATEHNKLVIVLDTFQSDVFEEIAARWPREVEFLRGFTFYPNTVGGYPTTWPSLPLMLTGKQYRNEMPIRLWARAAHREWNLVDHLAGAGYHATVATFAPTAVEGVSAPVHHVASLGEEGVMSRVRQALLVLDGGLFRASPTALRPYIYDDGRWLLSSWALDRTTPPGGHGADLRFVNALGRRAAIGGPERTFKFFHLAGAHWPLQINERFQFMPADSDGRDSYVRQARGVLFLLSRLLEELERLRVLESSEVLILSDHGSHNLLPNDTRGERRPEVGLTATVLAGSRPLFLHKPPASAHPLHVSASPRHVGDVPCILLSFDQSVGCPTQKSVDDPSRPRTYLHYHWSTEYHDWSKDYMPPMTEFLVRGDVRDLSAWENRLVRYESSRTEKFDPMNGYRVGETLTFARDGMAAYLREGWSGPESDRRWTEGAIATMNIALLDAPAGNLKLRLFGSAFPAQGRGRQVVRVSANGTELAIWDISELTWYEALLPRDVVAETISLSFEIREPTSPCDVIESKDCRKLGLDARIFEIVADPR